MTLIFLIGLDCGHPERFARRGWQAAWTDTLEGPFNQYVIGSVVEMWPHSSEMALACTTPVCQVLSLTLGCILRKPLKR